MDLYNTSKIIVFPIVKKIKSQINRFKCKLNSLFIINKYEYSSW